MGSLQHLPDYNFHSIGACISCQSWSSNFVKLNIVRGRMELSLRLVQLLEKAWGKRRHVANWVKMNVANYVFQINTCCSYAASTVMTWRWRRLD